MIFKKTEISTTSSEPKIFEEVLSLNGKNILELGCGRGELTRLIATSGKDRTVVATEVDEVQHKQNLKIVDLPNVKFELAGAQKITYNDQTFDRVLMFKSLHHVPLDLMDEALIEIRRVLKPDGLLYISEPLFQGEFNEVLRIFHDEETVREAAYNAVCRAVKNGIFKSQQQLFFNAPVPIAEFSVFEKSIIRVTHTDHQLDAGLLERVRSRFEELVATNGGVFKMPLRVDLLHK